MGIAPKILACIGLWLVTGISTAFAQSAGQSDKGIYTLFNPVPDDQMRDFNTDRPPKANVPYTVDAGHFQYETDLVNLAFNQLGGTVHTDTFLVPNPTFKFGLTNNIDFEINAPAGIGIHSFDAASGASSIIWGVNDVFLRTKVNLWGNDGGSSAFALIPYVKLPTPSAGIGNGAVEGGVIAPLSISLPKGFTLLFNSEVDVLKNIADNGRHANFINLVTVSHELVKDVTLYVEGWSDYNNDPLQPTTQYSFDLAAAWLMRRNLQLDFGIDFGLNRATPKVQVFTGLSQRF
jgi:Putative MetA-pathway of phenol degradation